MSVSFSSKKCDSCGGSLEYIPEKKIWRCRYCGQEVVREQQYDGLFTIKNVARQCLLDVARHQMDQAAKDLSECEKIDAGYIGTMAARLCYRLIAVITPGCCAAEQAASLYQRLKDDYHRLQERGALQEDEEDFYQFIRSADGADDAFAILILVFDTLGDEKRTDFLFKLLDPAKVYSKACNQDLLTYAFHHGRTDLARTITGNTKNLDLHSALDIVLAHCPDGEDKAAMARNLLSSGAYTEQDRPQVQQYLASSDSCGTKAAVLAACKGTGAMPDAEDIIQHVLISADLAQSGQVLDSLCDGHLYDNALYTLIRYAMKAPLDKALQVFAAIEQSGQFISISGKMLLELMQDNARPARDRAALFDSIRSHADASALELAASQYLCCGKDIPEDREVILNALLGASSTVFPAEVERYLQTCTADGPRKPAVLQQLFSLSGMRPAYFSKCLEGYLRQCPDPPDVCQQVMNALLDAGIGVGPAMLNDILCDDSISAPDKVKMLQKLESNGCTLRADALSVYLETKGPACEESLLAYLFDRCTMVSEKALTVYLLYCAHDTGTKAQNALALSEKITLPFGSTTCTVRHLGNQITCSLAQGYLLTCADSYDTASELLGAMAAQTRLTADIQVNGSLVRIKKYLKANRAALTPLTAQLCEDNRLFSIF